MNVAIPLGETTLVGDWSPPAGGRGVVVFVHGSGSSRRSPRNRRVAGILSGAGLGTLLMDLLTVDEEAVDLRTRHLRFDIPLLTERVVATLDWLVPRLAPGCPVGLFGASTGAAAALAAAAARPEVVAAVVSRGGRPDLAGDALGRVRAPTLLLVGERDVEVRALNDAARRRMTAPTELVVVAGATHLFEEPGTLDAVAEAARDFFGRHLRSGTPAPAP